MAFDFVRWMEDSGYCRLEKESFWCVQIHHLENWESKFSGLRGKNTYKNATFCFIVMVWIKVYVIIFAVFFLVDFGF